MTGVALVIGLNIIAHALAYAWLVSWAIETEGNQ